MEADFMLSHFLFVDDILLFTNGSLDEGRTLEDILVLYKREIRMVINVDKLVLCFNGVQIRIIDELIDVFHFWVLEFNEGFKYLGFLLNQTPINSRIGDGAWER